MFIVVLYGNAMNNLHDLNAEYKYHYIGCKLCILVIAPTSHINKPCELDVGKISFLLCLHNCMCGSL